MGKIHFLFRRTLKAAMSQDEGEVAGDRGPHAAKTYPLNSRSLTAKSVSRITKGLSLPTNASLAETRQMIKGRLAENHEPKNVQINVEIP